MKRNLLFLIGLCLLFVTGCNQSSKTGQPKEEKDAATTGQNVEIAVEDFVDLITQCNEAAATKCGMAFVYEDEVEGEDGDAGEYEIVFGKDVEKGAKDEYFGYDLKTTSNHAYYFSVFMATSINLNLCFVNPDDAKHMFEQLAQQEVIEGEMRFSVEKDHNQMGEEYLLLRGVDDDSIVIEIDAPVVGEDGIWRISIYQYV